MNNMPVLQIGKYEQGELELDVTKLEGHDFRSPCPNKDTCRPENCENYATKAEQCPPHSRYDHQGLSNQKTCAMHVQIG